MARMDESWHVCTSHDIAQGISENCPTSHTPTPTSPTHPSMQLRANLTSQHKCASRAPIISALPSPRVKLATLGSQRARVLARAKKGRGGGPGEEFLNGGEAYEIEFGKPAAPAEYWGKIANDSSTQWVWQWVWW